ncbi:hypothetical protein EYF80_068279 [Liparis tanakae]|uniref:Uncharacterized protein n=1 Tax=Liparis tanakae TaxID=230148 RepID=A0A4Z2DYU7_9TELE|nr:hypothetical protein EYF80_068279 [Liparis tanakae]
MRLETGSAESSIRHTFSNLGSQMVWSAASKEGAGREPGGSREGAGREPRGSREGAEREPGGSREGLTALMAPIIILEMNT